MNYQIYSGKNLISANSKLCKTFISKLIGFMFNFSKEYDSIILYSKNTSIHMLFVFSPLQIVWLNSKLQVVDIKNAYPFNIRVSSNKESKYILELRNFSNLELGDKLKIVNSV